MDEGIQHEYKREADEAAQQTPLSKKAGGIGLMVLVLVALVIAAVGILPRMHERKVLARDTNAAALPFVTASKPAQGSPSSEVVLPGNVYAYTDSPIFARTDGYLKKWNYDIGSYVHKGDLLATISAPELDQQVSQATADLQTAKTNAGLASTTAERYKGLLPSAAVSRQETETVVSQAASTNSSVNAATANLARFKSLQAYENVYAPFSGIVTARNVDVGQLISSGANGGAASQLFHMAAVDTLRVYVAVPQDYGNAALAGTAAYMTFEQFPGQRFPLKVTRTARYIDPTSRTLLVELDYKNVGLKLTPGSFTRVHFDMKSQVPTLTVPASALMFRSEGLRVGTVVPSGDGTGTAKLVPVTLGADDGRVVQVVDGLTGESLVIENPPDSLVDGETVRLAQPAPEATQGQSQ